MDHCPQHSLLHRINDPSLPADVRKGLNLHIELCDSCKQTVQRQNRPTPQPVGQTEVDTTSSGEVDAPRVFDPPGWLEPLIPDEFELIRPLGRGGMGVVYLVRDRRVNALRALKFYGPRSDEQQSLQSIERFRRESEISKQLDHPNIVRSFAAGETEGLGYIVSEYVEGRTLLEHLRENGPLHWNEATDLVLQVARGLNHAHLQGFIHRDVKPDNLMWATGGHVKILDMGLAKPFGLGNDAAEKVTESGFLVGTPEFMSPEQAAGERELGPQTDVYSLGCTFHQLVTGSELFGGQSLRISILRSHVHDTAPRISDICADFPRELESVFQKMVAKTPDQRYQSAGEVIDAIEASITRIENSRADLRPRWAHFGLALGVVAAILSALVFGSGYFAQQPSIYPQSRPADRLPVTKDLLPVLAPVPRSTDTWKPNAVSDTFIPVKTELPTLVNSLGMIFVEIPGKGNIKPFWFCIHETTVANYGLRLNPKAPEDGTELPDLLPAVKVNYPDATAFCQKLTNLAAEQTAGRRYRLPTFDEWHRAFVADTETDFFWGDDREKLGDFAWWDDNAGGQPHAVGMKRPNPFGLYDMQGNISVWTTDKSGFEERIIGGTYWVRRYQYNTSQGGRGSQIESYRASFIGTRLVCEKHR